MVNAGWLSSKRSEIFLQMKFIIFQGCFTKLPFYLGSLLHIISSLLRHFRSWDYPEHFGIYSQLDWKSKTWFFIFLDVYVSLERDKIPISRLSPPKFRYFADQNGRKGDPMKMNFYNFQCKTDVPKQLGLEKQVKKMGSLALPLNLYPDLWSLNCQKLCPFCNFLLISAKNLRLL